MTTEGLLNLAIAAIEAGRKDQGRFLLELVVDDDPGNELAWYWLAWCATKRDDRLHALKRVLEINPDNSKARAEWAKLTNDSHRKKRVADERYPGIPRLRRFGRKTRGFWIVPASAGLWPA